VNIRIARLVAAVALAVALALPGTAIAADPAPDGPPAAVTDWQGHLDHMRALDGNLGAHVRDCVEVHGSMAGMLGPNGSMAEMMAGGMMR
jgi:hypothetical protein